MSKAILVLIDYLEEFCGVGHPTPLPATGRLVWYDVFMDDAETMDRFKWEVITPDALQAAYQPIGRGEVYAILIFGRVHGAAPATIERVIAF